MYGSNISAVILLKIYCGSRSMKSRKSICFTIFAVFLVVFMWYAYSINFNQQPVYIIPIDSSLPARQENSLPSGYLVWSPVCQMPSLNPWANDVLKIFKPEKYYECSELRPYTRIEKIFSTNVTYLMVADNLKKSFYRKNHRLECCYQEIVRTGSNPDFMFNFTDCINFDKTIELPSSVEFLLVRCKSGRYITYMNSHAITRDRPEIRKKLKDFSKMYKKKPLSVLMMAIDSISRLNLMRAMPLTTQHLYDNGWFELQGYNKIDDNTFPNLMAILAGFNKSLANDVCKPTQRGKLDTCPFLWKSFHDAGYVTAYGEDEAFINTFNYRKTGFLKPPTDFYLRPYMLAAEENLYVTYKYYYTPSTYLKPCVGFKHSVDHVYDYALDFATTYKTDPFFGLFWTNSFSHNDINDPSAMDVKIRNYLLELENREILDSSVVIFFSDHGIRFGPVRQLLTGWLEERLPYMFIWLPEWFKDENPEIVQALKINRNRLTNPYDLHMTLKHILEISERTAELPQASSCRKCQSLFKEIPWNRSCHDAAIDFHWCTCSVFEEIYTNVPIVIDAARYAVKNMNEQLEQYFKNSKKLCAELKLKEISFSRKAKHHTFGDQYEVYIIVFKASPSGGWFEVTVRYLLELRNFEISGTISRLNIYEGQSECIEDDDLRKFCYCIK